MTAQREEPTLETVSHEDCVRLLEAGRFGRLAYGGEDGWPVVVPVNYRWAGTAVVVRVATGALLREVPLTAVAFEVDDADPEGEWGWSVLVAGPAFDITDAGDTESERLRDLAVRPWAPGIRDHWLKITPAKITGRRFGRPRDGR